MLGIICHTLLSADSKSAIVMDLDETVLDNSKYHRFKQNKTEFIILKVGHNGSIKLEIIIN